MVGETRAECGPGAKVATWHGQGQFCHKVKNYMCVCECVYVWVGISQHLR